MAFRFQILGPITAYGDAGPVPLGPAKQRTVLAALLLEPGTTVSIDQLVERVWGEQPPRSTRQTLHTYLSRLRTALGDAGGPPLVRRSHGYLLDTTPEIVDLHQFRAAVKRARAADDTTAVDLWGDAIALWRGEPLTDLDSDWARTVAAGLTRERLTAVLDYNDVLLRRGRHSDLLATLTADTAAHPLDERLAGQLMLTLYRCGRQADALAHYQRLRDRLVDEIGSDPGPELQELHQRLLRQDPALAAARAIDADNSSDSASEVPDAQRAGERGQAADAETAARIPAATAITPSQIPADVAGFTGRVDSMRRLDSLVTPAGQTPATVIISAIGGAAGMGKTALAVHWAHHVREKFPDGQVYLNLRGFDPGGQALTTDEALRLLLDLLQVPAERIPASTEAQIGLYRSRLAGTRTLVVLDNARDADQVRPLLPGAAGCMALVTSRNQLTGLAATEGAQLLRLDALTDIEARRLLEHRLGAVRVAAEPDAVTAIVTACGGLPLALAIVAARAATNPHFALATFAEELADAHSRLDALSVPHTATDTRAVFSWSYQALSPAAARLFRLLGLHSGPDISRNAAASLAGVPVPEARRILAELTGAHLLTEHTPGRYAIHDLLRAYAAELVAAADGADRGAARQRLLDYYLHATYAADQQLPRSRESLDLPPPLDGVVPEVFADSATAEKWLRTEHRVLLTLLSHGTEAGDARDFDELDRRIQDLARAINTFHLQYGLWHDKVTAETAGLAAARRRGDRTTQALFHRGLASACERLGRREEAYAHIHDARTLYEADGDHGGLASVYEILVFLSDRAGQHQEGLRYAELGLQSAEQAGSRRLRGFALNSVGWCHTLLGNHELAIDYCRQALSELQAVGEQIALFDIWNSLGHAERQLGRHQQAIDSYRQAVDLAHAVGSRWGVFRNLLELGDCHNDAGDQAAARQAWEQALQIADEHGIPNTSQLRQRLQAVDPTIPHRTGATRGPGYAAVVSG